MKIKQSPWNLILVQKYLFVSRNICFKHYPITWSKTYQNILQSAPKSSFKVTVV